MKHILLTLSSISLLASCVGSSPSIAGLGAGSDAAYMNATRGRADAQISSAQEEQYARQQRVVSREMDLEQKKRNNFYQNAGGIIGIARGLGSFVR